MNDFVGFNVRSQVGEKSLPAIVEILFDNKFLFLGKVGIEGYKKLIERSSQILMKDVTRLDPVIHSVRFGPDFVFCDLLNNYRGYKFELKRTKDMYYGYSMELDSFQEAMMDAKRYSSKRVLFILTTMTRIDACWVDDVLENGFVEIYVPSRFNESLISIKEKYGKMMPKCTFKSTSVLGGSGTPYGIIRKDSSYVKPLDIFLKDVRRNMK